MEYYIFYFLFQFTVVMFRYFNTGEQVLKDCLNNKAKLNTIKHVLQDLNKLLDTFYKQVSRIDSGKKTSVPIRLTAASYGPQFLSTGKIPIFKKKVGRVLGTQTGP